MLVHLTRNSVTQHSLLNTIAWKNFIRNSVICQHATHILNPHQRKSGGNEGYEVNKKLSWQIINRYEPSQCLGLEHRAI